MKKYIALLLVAVMLIGLMAGCGKKADEGQGRTGHSVR